MLSGVRWAMSRWRRLGLIFCAMVSAILGVSWWNIREGDSFLPILWPVALAVLSVLFVMMALMPRSQQVFAMTGSVMILCALSRPAVTVMNYYGGYTRSGWNVVSSLIVYVVIVAPLLATWWMRLVKPWLIRHQTGIKDHGD